MRPSGPYPTVDEYYRGGGVEGGADFSRHLTVCPLFYHFECTGHTSIQFIAPRGQESNTYPPLFFPSPELLDYGVPTEGVTSESFVSPNLVQPSTPDSWPLPHVRLSQYLPTDWLTRS